MKYLLILFFMMSLPVIAQDQKEDAQTQEWMTKISSDSELRSVVLLKILEAANGSSDEMLKLGKMLMDNPGMNSVLTSLAADKKSAAPISRGVMGDSTRTMKMVPMKKPR